MTDRNDYAGPFDPDFHYEDLSKEALVRLVREFALIVHLLDRSMCAAIGMRYGGDAVNELAVEEWRGASPVYGKRLRQIMNIEGDGVPAIFKVLQLDPGFPHHYMDVHYELVDENHGYFELAHCGALMDAEPWGERMVTGMCHHIEDGTFDYTAQAVNPKARIRPVHRPPRIPSDRVPHCRWEVVIDDDTETLPEADITRITAGTTAATFSFPAMRDGTPHIPRTDDDSVTPGVRPTTGPVEYSPYDYEIHEDPYPTYARLRAEAPIYRNDELDFWALSRHEDVLGAFRNPGQLSNRFGVSLDPAAYGPEAHRAMSFLAMDPPRHTRMRSLVSKAFTPRRVAELEESVRTIALEHIEAAIERGSFDFVVDFAGRLPMDVISDMIGVARSDRAELRRLADLLVHREEGIFDIPPQGIEAAMTLAGYFGGMVTSRRDSRTQDLTSALLDADLDGDRLTDDEVISFLFLMTVAGNETTTKLLANAWYWAWRFPDQRVKVLSDPTRTLDWVEETLRYDTSTQMLLRVTTGEVTFYDEILPDSARVLLLLGSANRDDRVFDRPDVYDVDRDTSKLVSFGSGRHFCLGAALARLEARVGLHELVARVSDYDIDPEGSERVHSINVRGFASLPTTVKAR